MFVPGAMSGRFVSCLVMLVVIFQPSGQIALAQQLPILAQEAGAQAPQPK